MNARAIREITQGETVRTMTWGEVCATECTHPGELWLNPHSHQDTSVAYVIEGDFVETVEGREFHCHQGSVLFKRSGVSHANRYGPAGARSLLVQVPAQLLERLELTSGLKTRAAHPIPGGAGAARAIHRELRFPSRLSALAVEGLLLQLLARVAGAEDLAAARKRPPRWLEQARDILHARYADPPSLSELAAAVEAHPDHLGRTFRRHYGTTPYGYVRQVRVDTAVRLIIETPQPLSEVALSVGYADQSHMTRAVRCATGAPPGRLRASNRGDG